MLYKACFVAFVAGSDAFQVGFSAPRSSVKSSKVAMQVAEAEVASPVALAKAADEARGLAIDSITKAKSGHMGLPLGCADIGAVLFGQEMSYNPEDVKWLNRDRFVLSAGHGSMFLYSWLHMAGYEAVTKEEVANFRAKDSITPGHPENFMTPGVECTTGPLGQGIGNGAGMAAAAKFMAAKLNTPEHTIIDHHVVVLCGDGCLQEGVANEAAAFAGHEKLDNMILMYDSNGVTLDKMAEHTQSEDVQMRFEAQGWEVLTVDGHDMDALTEPWEVSSETYDFFAKHKAEQIAKYDEWQEMLKAWKAANPDKAKMLQDALDGTVPDLDAMIPEFPTDKAMATRNAGAEVIQPIGKSMPFYVSGSADLHGSNKNYIKEVGDFSKNNYGGRNFYYGIREHAMGAILNGMGFYGLFRASGSTFLVFSDYMRSSVRVAALSHLPINYIWTHDSIGVGEDGPTHQPVETVSSLRMIPNLDVMRPGDAEETAAAYIHAINRKTGPTALILSRQNLPTLDVMDNKEANAGALKGAYVLVKETAALTHVLLAVGSELHVAVEAAKELGAGCRVVSIPCMELFEAQDDAYKASVLPDKSITTAVEAGVTAVWYKYADKVVGVDSFGESAPAQFIFEAKGITTANIVATAK